MPPLPAPSPPHTHRHHHTPANAFAKDADAPHGPLERSARNQPSSKHECGANRRDEFSPQRRSLPATPDRKHQETEAP
jgi:hypothetical protein